MGFCIIFKPILRKARSLCVAASHRCVPMGRRSGVEVELAMLGRVHELGPHSRVEGESWTRRVLAVAYGNNCVEECDLDTVVAAVSVAAAALFPDSSAEMMREHPRRLPSLCDCVGMPWH